MKTKIGDYTPTRDWIMIEPEREKEKSDGGIVIPEQARRTMNEGEVLLCGPDVLNITVGMFIVYTESSDYKLKMDDGRVVCVVQEENVILTRSPLKGLFAAGDPNAARCAQHDHLMPCPICSDPNIQPVSKSTRR